MQNPCNFGRRVYTSLSQSLPELIYNVIFLDPQLIDGDRSIKVAESIQNYATLHDTIGNVREAEKLYREALAIYDRCKY